MIPGDVREIVEGLLQKSRNGDAEWTVTSGDEEEFVVNLPAFSAFPAFRHLLSRPPLPHPRHPCPILARERFLPFRLVCAEDENIQHG